MMVLLLRMACRVALAELPSAKCGLYGCEANRLTAIGAQAWQHLCVYPAVAGQALEKGLSAAGCSRELSALTSYDVHLEAPSSAQQVCCLCGTLLDARARFWHICAYSLVPGMGQQPKCPAQPLGSFSGHFRCCTCHSSTLRSNEAGILNPPTHERCRLPGSALQWHHLSQPVGPQPTSWHVSHRRVAGAPQTVFAHGASFELFVLRAVCVQTMLHSPMMLWPLSSLDQHVCLTLLLLGGSSKTGSTSGVYHSCLFARHHHHHHHHHYLDCDCPRPSGLFEPCRLHLIAASCIIQSVASS